MTFRTGGLSPRLPQTDRRDSGAGCCDHGQHRLARGGRHYSGSGPAGVQAETGHNCPSPRAVSLGCGAQRSVDTGSLQENKASQHRKWVPQFIGKTGDKRPERLGEAPSGAPSREGEPFSVGGARGQHSGRGGSSPRQQPLPVGQEARRRG